MTSEKGWVLDLVAVAVATALAAFAVTADLAVLRAALVVPLVTFLPGYAVVAFLYPAAGQTETRPFDENESGLKNPLPTKRGLTSVERTVFSVVVSIVVVSVTALAANFTPQGVTTTPILAGVAGVTGLFVLGAFVRRLRTSPERRYSPSPLKAAPLLRESVPHPTFRDVGNRRLFNVALVLSVLVFAASVGYAAVNPPETESFTEFNVDTENVSGDTQSMYPSQYQPGETRKLPVTVTNHEGESVEYQMVVLLQRTNGNGSNTNVVMEERLAQRTFNVADGASHNETLSITPNATGSDLRLVLLLYQNDLPNDPSRSNAYRTLELPIDVGANGSNAGSRGRPADNTAKVTDNPHAAGV